MGLTRQANRFTVQIGLSFLISFFVEEAFGQRRLPGDSAIWYVGSQAHYGFIIAHRDAIRPLVKDTNPWGLSVEISRLKMVCL